MKNFDGLEYSKDPEIYWVGTAERAKELMELENLFPNSGEAETTHGELLRIGARFNYDLYNNGACNIFDVITEDCSGCGGSGFEEDDEGELSDEDCGWCDGHCTEITGGEMNPYWDNMLETLINIFNDYGYTAKTAEALRECGCDVISMDLNFLSSDKYCRLTSQLIDEVWYIIKNTENKPNEYLPVS